MGKYFRSKEVIVRARVKARVWVRVWRRIRDARAVPLAAATDSTTGESWSAIAQGTTCCSQKLLEFI